MNINPIITLDSSSDNAVKATNPNITIFIISLNNLMITQTEPVYLI